MRCFLFLLIVTLNLSAQSLSEAEPQISFAKEIRPYAYYLAQADLWWQEVEKDPQDQMAWWNYYRACRNAEGSNNWQSDFVKDGPNLRLGADIVRLMEKAIPNSFIYNYVKGSTAGVDPQNGPFLLKAYAENPDFGNLLADVVTYATSTHNDSLRKEANIKWFKKRTYNAYWMAFAHNLLASTEEGAILFTQGDNDSYPLWMLQDAKGQFSGISVINIDFLVLGSYREKVFRDLNIPAFEIGKVIVDDYEQNWEDFLHHFLREYKGNKAVYVSSTVNPRWYHRYSDQFSPSGIALKFRSKEDLPSKDLNLFRNSFYRDSWQEPIVSDPMQARFTELQVHYIPYFERLLRNPNLQSFEKSSVQDYLAVLKEAQKSL